MFVYNYHKTTYNTDLNQKRGMIWKSLQLIPVTV